MRARIRNWWPGGCGRDSPPYTPSPRHVQTQPDPAPFKSNFLAAVVGKLSEGTALTFAASICDNLDAQYAPSSTVEKAASRGTQESPPHPSLSGHRATSWLAQWIGKNSTPPVAASKGSFTGSLKLKDGSTLRNVTYEGLFIGGAGEDFFTLSQLPLTKTSPVLSGKVVLEAK